MIDELIAGDTLDFYDDVPDYPPNDGWTLKYYLSPRFTTPTQTLITISSITEGTRYRLQAAAGITIGWAPGAYTWKRRVEKAGPINQSLGEGQIVIKTAPSLMTQGFDGRTHARKMLDQINAALEALSLDVKSYAIGSRTMTKRDIPELLTLRDRYMAEASNEEAAAEIASGLSNPRSFGIRFNRV